MRKTAASLAVLLLTAWAVSGQRLPVPAKSQLAETVKPQWPIASRGEYDQMLARLANLDVMASKSRVEFAALEQQITNKKQNLKDIEFAKAGVAEEMEKYQALLLPASAPTTAEEKLDAILRRLDDLEKRVAELEKKK